MNTPVATPPASTLLADAITACETLAVLLETENVELKSRRVQQVEARTKEKAKLAAKLEKTLADIKINRDSVAADAALQTSVKHLQERFDFCQHQARQNLLLLRSAHQTRVEMIQYIRDAINAQKPKADLYTATGQMATTGAPAVGGINVVNKEI